MPSYSANPAGRDAAQQAVRLGDHRHGARRFPPATVWRNRRLTRRHLAGLDRAINPAGKILNDFRFGPMAA